VHFLDVPYAELVRRLKTRNADPPAYTFPVTQADLAQMVAYFEPPDADELREVHAAR
jgi:hypothetical protein